MKRFLALVSLCGALVPAAARSERVVREITWSALKSEGRLAGGEVVRGAAGAPDSLRVTNAAGVPRAIALFELADPGVGSTRFLLRGDVRGEGVEGAAYLEMWSVFRGGGRFFSRTLAPSGPMGSLGGTFAARPFLLPFTAEPGMTLERLVVNVAFPGRGTVVLGPMRLVELDPGEEVGVGGAGPAPRDITRLGAALGTLLGLVGAAVGLLTGLGRARVLALGLLWSMLGIGVVSLVGAALAGRMGLPGAVPVLALVGAVGVGVPALLLGTVRRRFEEAELRRMQALDAR